VKAEDSEQRGLNIVREADNRDNGFQDFTANMLMTLRNRNGQESTRQIRMNVLEVEDDGDKSLTIFDTPKDVKGTAFLTFSHKIDDDDQWLFLPALKRVKRISSSNKSGSFMGSEFSYEDFSGQEVEKYEYRWIRDEVNDNKECFIVEYYPIDKKNSGYSRQVVWIDKKDYLTMKVEFYDKKDSHFKTLTLRSYKQYLNKYWRPDEYIMINHQNGKSTTLNFSDYKFSVGLNDNDFNKNALKRVR